MLYFVGVGPGDPELVTMKAVRILQKTDAIVLPDCGKDSVVWKIAGEWMKDKPVCSVSIPMKGKKQEWKMAHRRAAEQLLEWLNKYETIAYPVLGDPGIYASSSYLMKHIAPHHPCKVIPGIPAMCAAAAALGIPLCEQHESLAVVDHLDGVKQTADSVVVMKSGKQMSEIRDVYADRKVHVVCNLGMEDEWTGEIQQLPSQMQSYFMTAIVKHSTE